jgi:hypothetical protein
LFGAAPFKKNRGIVRCGSEPSFLHLTQKGAPTL